QLVIFTITGEDYGLDVQIVDSIIKRQPITAVPNTPDYVEGVINLRGEVLPVVDLRRRLGLPLQEFTKDTRIIVAELPGAKVGLLVDTMVEVLLVPQQAIQPPSPLISTVETAFISGIVNVGAFETGKVDERLIVLLNLENVLSIRRQ
ncbi:MAG TPA: chemotaxis protein CheW, partial [Chloroflexi bacterium]|nr:chemotaxis protein CheW [Chloroflexota bacterium]